MIRIKRRKLLNVGDHKIQLIMPYMADTLTCSYCRKRINWNSFLGIKWVWNYRQLDQCSKDCHKAARNRWDVRYYHNYQNRKINWCEVISDLVNKYHPLNLLERL